MFKAPRQGTQGKAVYKELLLHTPASIGTSKSDDPRLFGPLYDVQRSSFLAPNQAGAVVVTHCRGGRQSMGQLQARNKAKARFQQNDQSSINSTCPWITVPCSHSLLRSKPRCRISGAAHRIPRSRSSSHSNSSPGSESSSSSHRPHLIRESRSSPHGTHLIPKNTAERCRIRIRVHVASRASRNIWLLR